ncbi:hypothetical protein [Acinetobacter sp.]|uniref:hypothetical protein n=1 Tax=Acinetobacter sp. TaxID=472 RepID=UPI00264A45A1|nr:hypothetical protein [Acinetobacter sp.]MDN5512273.1 hypothetical protein [Acinetobacter sp.]MDN5525709.1 hypothetical protein [Acinetobacter sp.]
MNKVDWILLKNETRRFFDKATWVPLRASQTNETGNIKRIGYEEEYFGCGSVAFPKDQLGLAEKLSWGR